MSPVKSFQTLSNSTQQQYVRWCSRLVKTRESVSRGHSLIYCRKFGLPHPAMVTVAIRAAGPSPTNVLQWGAADAEIKVPSVENTELSGSPFKAWSRSVYGHTCYAFCELIERTPTILIIRYVHQYRVWVECCTLPCLVCCRNRPNSQSLVK